MSHQERWQLDANPDEQYERYLVPAMFAPWASDLVELAEPHLGERVLDVACGTGVVARLMASHVGVTGKVVGLDFAAGRLSVARSHISAQGVEVEWREGMSLHFPLPMPNSILSVVIKGCSSFRTG